MYFGTARAALVVATTYTLLLGFLRPVDGHLFAREKVRQGLRSSRALVIDVDRRRNQSAASLAQADVASWRKPKGFKTKSKARAPKRGWAWENGKGSEDQWIDPSLGCGLTWVADADSNKYTRCPKECPLFARDLENADSCAFQCVRADQCASANPQAPVPDLYYGECRSPNVAWCAEYHFDGSDTCKTCKLFFHLDSNGHCEYDYWLALKILGCVVLVVIVLIVAWWTDMECRPVSNEPGLEKGLLNRERQKLRMPDDPDTPGSQRYDWPFFTNLCRESVAGPGMVLHFNFQVMIIVWALFVAACWGVFCYYDEELLVLGTRKFGLARANCILVAWGSETQQRLMWTKIYFLVIVYTGSFLGCIFHGARQRRIFRVMDENNTTMKDFVGICEGLPPLQGEEQWEVKLKDAIQESLGEDVKVVGVSICWDFRHCVDEVMGQARKDTLATDIAEEAATPRDPPPMNPVRNIFFVGEKHTFGVEQEEPDIAGETEVRPRFERALSLRKGGSFSNLTIPEDELHKKVKAMTSSDSAFVVFKTEQERNMAVERLAAKGGFIFEGSKVDLKTINCEPDTVQWWHFGAEVTPMIRFTQLMQGLGCVCLGLFVWCVLFYGPYCWSVLEFNYDNGQEPDAMYGFVFSMVVVVGNTIMYEICARVSNWIGFLYSDHRETCYMAMYTAACTLQVVLDLVITWFVAWEITTSMNFRTADGKRLEEVDSFTERFESYAMQRRLAENAFDYAYPSTFLIPFIIEPFVTILLPLRMGILIVRSHPEILGQAAEEWLATVPFDMGRYADLILNVILSIIIFYFPGGYTLRLFLLLAACHVFIYCLDHTRVLRVIPACKFATMDVDVCSQILLIPCCGLILSSLVFKANCQGYGYCFDGMKQVAMCCAAFLLHCLIHYLCLLHVVPVLGGDLDSESSDVTVDYATMAKKEACSWFNSNPVNCLRSKYIYKHDPPCLYWILGKEHNLLVNQAIGCYFDDDPAETCDLATYKSGLSSTTPRAAGSKSPGSLGLDGQPVKLSSVKEA